MKCLIVSRKLLQLKKWTLIIWLAMLNQAVSARDIGYWDDRFGVNQFYNENYIHSIGVTNSGEIFASGWLIVNGKTRGLIKWNGNSWSSFGSGIGSVHAFLQIDNDLYIGGEFSKVDSVGSANNIAKYNLVNKTWSPLGSGENNGTDHIVSAIAVQGNDLYVGGAFKTAGGIPANHIAKYNIVTKTWAPLGDGVDGSVQAIAVKNGEVYVGSSVGDVPANNIAKWNGHEWSALGSGVNSKVYALTFCGDDLYVGGIFTQAGGNRANYIAKWNISTQTWSNVGGGIDEGFGNGVFALASNGRVVYVGGRFSYASGMQVGAIAKWNPVKGCWSRVGGNRRGDGGSVDGQVNTILIRGNDIYLGGKFRSAGGKPSQLFAIWHGPTSPGPHAPAWSSVPDITFQEDDSTQLELYQFVTDVEHDLRGLNFGAKVIKFQKTAAAKPSPILNDLQIRLKKIIMGPNGRYEYATFTSAKDASGIYTVVFTATDPCGASDSDTIKVTVTPVNASPVLATLPELRFNEDKTLFHPIRHWYPFVTDNDNPDNTLKFTVLSGKRVKATRHPRGYAFSAPVNWFGRDTLQVIVTDPNQLADTTSLVITVDPINDKPRWTGMPDSLSFKQGASTTLKMWDFAEDAETPDSFLLYRFSTSKPGLRWSFHRPTGTFVLTAPQFHGKAHLFIKAGDGKAAAYDTIAVRVEKPNDILAAIEKQKTQDQIPSDFVLQQNYPNPFNPTTQLRYELPQPGHVTLFIYNALGQEVRRLVDRVQPAGYHLVTWNGRDQNGKPVPSGVYHYRLQAGDFVTTKKMLMAK